MKYVINSNDIYSKDLGNVKILSEDETLEMHRLMCDGDTNARNLLIESSLRWCKQLVSKHVSRYNLDSFHDEILQDLHVHLCLRIVKWNPKKGKLSTFVAICTRNFLLNWWHSSRVTKTLTHIPRRTQRVLSLVGNNSSKIDELPTNMRNLVRAAQPILGAVYYDAINRKYLSSSKEKEDSGDGIAEYDDINNHIKNNKDETIDIEKVDLITKLVNKCSKEEQELLKWKYVDNLTDDVIAKKFNISRQAMSFRIQKLLDKLKYSVESSSEDLISRDYLRNCPRCNKELVYKSNLDFKRACKKNTGCHKCNKQLCILQ